VVQGGEVKRLDVATGALTGTGAATSGRVAVSPDGTRIAYAKDSLIFVRNLQTGDEVSVATSGNGDRNPCFSYEGSLVGYEAGSPPILYQAKADGTGDVEPLQGARSTHCSWGP
jgi:Tol biopolymer transport system component